MNTDTDCKTGAAGASGAWTASAKPVRPRWWRVYFLLAAFDLVTISFSLNLNHRLMRIHEESVRINQEWASQLNQISDLAQLGGAVNAPGNDVFDSRDVASESARLGVALSEFNSVLARTETSLLASAHASNSDNLKKGLGIVRESMSEMTAEADLIFSFFREGRPEKAGERMATMDRKYAKLNNAFAQLGRDIREIQTANFASQREESVELRKYENVIAVSIVLMVLAVTVYGHRMSKAMGQVMTEKERYLRELQEAHAGLEQRVQERTAELREEIIQRKQAQEEARKTQDQLVLSSRQAGMAEVANSVLHNVGNVLNSVNVSSGQLSKALRESSAADVGKVADLMHQHASDIGGFISHDPKGRQIPKFLGQLAAALDQERRDNQAELELLTSNIDHIKQIITLQQGIARPGGVRELVSLPQLFDQALAINLDSLTRHEIEVVREFHDLSDITIDRHQVLQILVNLIRNAKQSMLTGECGVKRMTLRTLADPSRPGFVAVQVVDTGMGIKPEHLPRLFAQGFTTKKDGHGFGLHSGSLSAKALGGALLASSEGEGRGATFTLTLPGKPSTVSPV